MKFVPPREVTTSPNTLLTAVGAVTVWADAEGKDISGTPTTISPLTGTVSVPFGGSIETDTIDETTSAAGVTIDGVLIKDGEVDGADISTECVTALVISNPYVRESTVTVSNSAAWTDVVDVTLSAGDFDSARFDIQVHSSILNNTGGNATMKTRVQIDGVTICDGGSGNMQTNSSWRGHWLSVSLQGHASSIITGIVRSHISEPGGTTGSGAMSQGEADGPNMGQSTGHTLSTDVVRVQVAIQFGSANTNLRLSSPCAWGTLYT